MTVDAREVPRDFSVEDDFEFDETTAGVDESRSDLGRQEQWARRDGSVRHFRRVRRKPNWCEDHRRCRFVARGLRHDDPDMESLHTSVSTTPVGRLVDVNAVQHGYSVLCLDAENSYFHADEDKEFYCCPPSLPSLLPPATPPPPPKNGSIGTILEVRGEPVVEVEEAALWEEKGCEEVQWIRGDNDSRSWARAVSWAAIALQTSWNDPGLELHQDDFYVLGNNVELGWLQEHLGAAQAEASWTDGSRIAVQLPPSDESKGRRWHHPHCSTWDLHQESLRASWDIAFAVHEVSKSLPSPGDADLRRLKWVGRYLLGTREVGVRIRKAHDTEYLEVYTDADWSGDPISRKSTSGGVLKIGLTTLREFTNRSELPNAREWRTWVLRCGDDDSRGATLAKTSGILGATDQAATSYWLPSITRNHPKTRTRSSQAHWDKTPTASSETRGEKVGRGQGTDPDQRSRRIHQDLQTAKYLEWRSRLGMEYDNGDEAETSKREALAGPGRWARVEAIQAIPHSVLIPIFVNVRNEKVWLEWLESVEIGLSELRVQPWLTIERCSAAWVYSRPTLD